MTNQENEVFTQDGPSYEEAIKHMPCPKCSSSNTKHCGSPIFWEGFNQEIHRCNDCSHEWGVNWDDYDKTKANRL